MGKGIWGLGSGYQLSVMLLDNNYPMQGGNWDWVMGSWLPGDKNETSSEKA
jgi:hypothetical protein